MLERKAIPTFSSKSGIIVTDGSEANITIDKNKKIVYKEWKTNMIPTISNKIKKLEEMAKIKELDNYIVETSYITEHNNKETGYVMPFKQNEEPDFYKWPYKYQISYLAKLKETINFFREIGLYYFDFSPYNIYIEKGTIKLLDKDNVQIGNLKSDLYSIFLKNYIKQGGNFDEHAMIYAYNQFVFTVLTKTFECRAALKEISENPNFYKFILENKDIEIFVKDLLQGKINCITDHEFLIDRFQK